MTFTFQNLRPAPAATAAVPRQDGRVNAFDLVQAWPSGGETRKKRGREGGEGGGKTEALGLTLHQNSPICPLIYGNMSLSNSAINKDNIYKRACQTPSGLSSAP